MDHPALGHPALRLKCTLRFGIGRVDVVHDASIVYDEHFRLRDTHRYVRSMVLRRGEGGRGEK